MLTIRYTKDPKYLTSTYKWKNCSLYVASCCNMPMCWLPVRSVREK